MMDGNDIMLQFPNRIRAGLTLPRIEQLDAPTAQKGVRRVFP
jgi:hypothetical protein